MSGSFRDASGCQRLLPHTWTPCQQQQSLLFWPLQKANTHCALMLLGTEGQVGGLFDFARSHESFMKGLQHWITRTWPSLYLREWVWGRAGGGIWATTGGATSDGTLMPAHIMVCALRKYNKVKSIYSVLWLFGSGLTSGTRVYHRPDSFCSKTNTKVLCSYVGGEDV